MSTAEATDYDPVLPDAQMNIVPPTKPVVGRVVSTRLCMKGKSASFIRHVAIDVAGTPLAGSFHVGQSFGVIAPGVDAEGKPHKVRLYSIASPSWGEDGQGMVLSTTPKRVLEEVPFAGSRIAALEGGPENRAEPSSSVAGASEADIHDLYIGVCSNYLCNLRVGEEVLVSGPSGKRFLLPANPSDHDYIFIATGTGIAPFRGMAMELLEHPNGPCTSQIHLLMGSPYTTDLLYDDLFTRYDREHSNFHYHTAISRELRPDGRRGLYVDRLLEEKFDALGPLLESPRTLIYICGLAGMQVGVFTALAAHGLGGPYLKVKDELASVPPEKWEPAAVKRYVRSTNRCMLEVY
jgi:ferredoxin--NADP+ reductase